MLDFCRKADSNVPGRGQNRHNISLNILIAAQRSDERVIAQ